jgi:hypothetical protein
MQRLIRETNMVASGIMTQMPLLKTTGKESPGLHPAHVDCQRFSGAENLPLFLINKKALSTRMVEIFRGEVIT